MEYKNYKSIEEFYVVLSHSDIKYVVLRNYENMHKDNFFVGGHEDIDILVDDVDKFVAATGVVPKMWPEDKWHFIVFIEGMGIPLDVREVGDCYYDPKWEADILERRQIADNGNWFVMSENDYYYTLAYHSILQKYQTSQEYIKRLDSMAEKLGLNVQGEKHHLKQLDVFMKTCKYKYTPPKDTSVSLMLSKMKNKTKIVRCMGGVQLYCKTLHQKSYCVSLQKSVLAPHRLQPENWKT